MAQQPIELILLRQWASYLAIPLWIVDTNGDLLFYNEPAEAILGKRFDEAGQINASELASLFRTSAPNGANLANHELPIVIALTEHRPAHAKIRFQTFNHIWRDIDVSAFPVEGQSGANLGAVAMFWETSPS